MSIVLDLALIGDRHCPTTRTYLTYFAANGFVPKELLLVDFLWGVRPSWHKRVPGALPQQVFKRRLRAVKPVYNDVFLRQCEAVQADVPLPIDFSAPFEFKAHALSCVELVADDFDDADLHRAIASLDAGALLYTNGGLVPESFLRNSPPMLHIHPGVVPHVRGSDGLFWSLLLRGRPGASCFYMAPGIDEGALILAREFPPPDLRRCRELPFDFPTMYVVLLTAYDPHLRAMTLLDVLARAHQTQREAGELRLDALQVTQQNLNGGRAYFAMHPVLVRRVIEGLMQREALL